MQRREKEKYLVDSVYQLFLRFSHIRLPDYVGISSSFSLTASTTPFADRLNIRLKAKSQSRMYQ